MRPVKKKTIQSYKPHGHGHPHKLKTHAHGQQHKLITNGHGQGWIRLHIFKYNNMKTDSFCKVEKILLR